MRFKWEVSYAYILRRGMLIRSKKKIKRIYFFCLHYFKNGFILFI